MCTYFLHILMYYSFRKLFASVLTFDFDSPGVNVLRFWREPSITVFSAEQQSDVNVHKGSCILLNSVMRDVEIDFSSVCRCTAVC